MNRVRARDYLNIPVSACCRYVLALLTASITKDVEKLRQVRSRNASERDDRGNPTALSFPAYGLKPRIPDRHPTPAQRASSTAKADAIVAPQLEGDATYRIGNS